MTKKKKKSRSGKITTPLAGHKRVGKALVPPMLQLEGVSFSSWVNDRLPETTSRPSLSLPRSSRHLSRTSC